MPKDDGGDKPQNIVGPATVYTIPPGVPFAHALVGELLERFSETPDKLSRVRLMLPTRRACRNVREAFLQYTAGKPLVLPQMQAIGDVDEEEMTLTIAGEDEALARILLEMPAALPPLQRQILLAQTIMARPDYKNSPDHAMALAQTLGQLMDHIYTENLDLADLGDLVTGEFATHWEITLTFLTILTENWPKILAERNVIDEADRRNRLLNILADHWTSYPPQTPIIAAGSTGSIPATGRLLSVVAKLPQGIVVLPGLDQDMDQDGWDSLTDTHPQATLKTLLSHLEITRDDVGLWPIKAFDRLNYVEDRHRLMSEVMRPAATTEKWAGLADNTRTVDILSRTLDGLTRCDCDTTQTEATVIALYMREVLETPGKTASLVTPDRELARRVAMICQRWGITVDDSGGQKLGDTPLGVYMRLIVAAYIEEFAPVTLLALLKHNLTAIKKKIVDSDKVSFSKSTLQAFEKLCLRGLKPAPGFEGLRARLSEKQDDKDISAFESLITFTETAYEGFVDGKADIQTGHLATKPFAGWLDAHLKTAERLAHFDEEQNGAQRLWCGDSGEAAAGFFARMREQAHALPEMTAGQYLKIIEDLMGQVAVRPSYGMHPRLTILGQLEARLLQADLIILSGLNEGTWPPDPGHDPWMSRPMKKEFGLPGPERSIGLAAHDFIQGACAPMVVLTRALRKDGAPTVAARWLQRLDAVLQAIGINPAIIETAGQTYKALADQIDHAPNPQPCERPAPTPPVSQRPRQLYVTQIETLMNDPYGVYAALILGLKSLDPLEQPPSYAERGNVIHKTMERFITATRTEFPANDNEARLMMEKIGRAIIEDRTDDPAFWDFWWPRFREIVDWSVQNERSWRTEARVGKLETKGHYTVDAPAGDFTISAKLDRIDYMTDDQLAIIDYKSAASNYNAKAIVTNNQPQLPLEGVIAAHGGFTDIPAASVGCLAYWTLTGGQSGGKRHEVRNPQEVIEQAEEGVRALITRYDDPTQPYYSLPTPDRIPAYNDYEHLARVQEWSAQDETGGEG